MPFSLPTGLVVPVALPLIMLLPAAALWRFCHPHLKGRWHNLVTGSLVAALLISIFGGWPAPAAAAPPALPRYAYMIPSSPTSYDLMLWDAGKDKLLVRTAVLGTGVADTQARIAPDGARVAYRVTNDRNGGGSLRLFDIQARKAITVTYSKSANLGVGTFGWSPDSRLLAFSWTTPAMPKPDEGYGSIWVVDASGKNLRKILSAQLEDRFVAWSSDSRGFYFERQEEVEGVEAPLRHLMYMPLDGKPRSVLRSVAPGKKTPGLLFDTFQVWAAPPGKDAAPAPARVAALAVGDLGLLPQTLPMPLAVPPTTPPLTAAKVATTTVATDEVPALVVGLDDGSPFLPLSIDNARPDLLAWGSTGGYLLAAGGKKAAALRFELGNGKRIGLAESLARMQPIAWSADHRYAVFANLGLQSISTIITADMNTGKLTASRKVGTTEVVGASTGTLDIPYINQVWDTANSVNGNWACGPTSVAMILSYYGRLDPWPLDPKSAKAPIRSMAVAPKKGATPTPTPARFGRDYAQYISAPFTYKERKFTKTSLDPTGRKVAGLYGSIVFPDGLAHWEAMQEVLAVYDLKASFIPATWAGITAALDKGYPVLVGTRLTDEGHILVARGYTSGGYLVVNDPYGNKFGPNGYGGPDGENILYPWKKATVRLAMQVTGTVWTPTPTPPAAITATVTPDP